MSYPAIIPFNGKCFRFRLFQLFRRNKFIVTFPMVGIKYIDRQFFYLQSRKVNCFVRLPWVFK
jgi:hypothetical protein